MTAAQAGEEPLRPFAGGDLPVRLRAWDGAETGPRDAPLVAPAPRGRRDGIPARQDGVDQIRAVRPGPHDLPEVRAR